MKENSRQSSSHASSAPPHSPSLSSPSLEHLSPLDQIRQTEAEVTRKVVQARGTASKIVQEARDQTQQMLQQARVDGEHEGQARYKEILKKSEDEATGLVAEARQQAEGLRQAGKAQMETLVERIVNFITGLEDEI